MKIFGKTHVGGTVFEVPADYKRVVRVRTPTQPIRIPKLTFACDGLGSGAGAQPWRGIIYDIFGNLIAEGDEHLVPSGMVLTWFDLRFSLFRSGVPLLPNTAYDFGFHAGPPGNIIRVYGDASQGV